MRTAFIETLTELARDDDSIMLLTGDLGFTVLEPFRDELPNQFLNAGIAEQNMIGTAAGLALSGKHPVAYSIIPFVTMRCFEQIRDDVCYHNLPVCMVGVGAGYSYSIMGSTHHALEDIAIMRALPNMIVLCPGDPVETKAVVHAALKHDGPCYIRLGKAGEPTIHPKALESYTIGEAIELQNGDDVTLFVTSTMLQRGHEATQALTERGVSVRLLSMPSVKPIDTAAICRAAADTRLLVTVEEHSAIGGLGSAIAEVMVDQQLTTPMIRCAAPDEFMSRVGSRGYCQAEAKLDQDTIVDRICTSLAS